MKNFYTLILVLAILNACTTLTRQEQNTLRSLKSQGITVDKTAGDWERPANPAGAGALNLLPGFGNFYLASGNGGDSSHYLYGFLNLLSWPISIIWGIPEAAIDANRINERELIYYYTYDESTNTYTVYSAEGLNEWAKAANQNLSTDCILMTDIDLSGVDWNPIGNGVYYNEYTGTFDGNGHAIRNLRQDGSYEYGGFIGHIGTNGRVQNLTLSDVNINNTYLGRYPSEMGAVTGYNEGTISNCEISGSVSQTSEYGNLGSLVGNNTGDIEYCRSSATIHGDGNNYVGGLVGQHGSYVTSSFVRGCSFSGNIIGGYSVGGITGWCPYFYTVIACYSTGTLSNEYNKGGIVGFLQHGSETTACYWEGFDGASFGYCNSGEGSGAYQIDGTTHTWQTATEAMNEALGTDAAYHWYTASPDTPPTLVPNN